MRNCLNAIGFWRCRDWPLLFPHPKELCHLKWNPDEKVKIVRYLDAGLQINLQLGYPRCRFGDGPPEEEMGDCERTDGVWVWPEGLSVYVANYNTMLPDSFLHHARSKEYVCQNEIDEESIEVYRYSYREWVQWASSVRSNRFLAMASNLRLRLCPIT